MTLQTWRGLALAPTVTAPLFPVDEVEKIINNHYAVLAYAKEEGKTEVAIEMLKDGTKAEDVVRLTNLSKQQIEKLKVDISIIMRV